VTLDTLTPRSRRALLASALGTIGVTVATAVLPRESAEAANGNPLVLGSSTNTATATTRLSGTGATVEALTVEAVGTAVHGNSSTGYGVIGSTTRAGGVLGSATTGVGVNGHSDNGTGVDGYSPSGTGIRARSGTGLALSVDGRVHFNRSGRVWIRAGHASLVVTVPGTASSHRVLAVLANNRPGRYVRAVVPATGTFTVYLNAAVLTDSIVTWFAFE
jgi:hypothetical protein